MAGELKNGLPETQTGFLETTIKVSEKVFIAGRETGSSVLKFEKEILVGDRIDIKVYSKSV